MIILSLALVIVLALLSGLHFYWMAGGQRGLDVALPTQRDGRRLFNPTALDCALIGVLLMAFTFYYLVQSSLVSLTWPAWVSLYAGWGIPLIFMLRAIGDFRYVGFFKRERQSDFAAADSRYFSPLCLVIAVTGILIQLVN